MLKLGLLLVMLHALHEAHSYHKIHDGWDIISPHRVRATRGSCVVIPCSYTFPPKKNIKSYHGLWKKGVWGVNVASSWANDHVAILYKRRTRFLGQVQKKSCTWMLTNVQNFDAAHYYFRIEMAGYDSYSWVIPKTEVQLVDATPPELAITSHGPEGDRVAYCTVTHSCPYYPPTLTWNRNGTVMNRSQQVNDWLWMTYSLLHIRPHNDFQELYCSVTHHSGQKLRSFIYYLRIY